MNSETCNATQQQAPPACKVLATRWRILILVLLLAVSSAHIVLTLNTSALLWLKRTWNTRAMQSMERSEIYIFGQRGADYLQFLKDEIPPKSSLVVPSNAGWFSQQNFLQFFLMPRTILGCSCNSEQKREICNQCIQDPSTYVPAIGEFPPEGVLKDKTFIPYPEDTGFYHGIFLPEESPSPIQQAIEDPEGSRVLALGIDLGLLLGLCFLGAGFALVILRESQIFEILSLALPLGGGLYTLTLYLASMLGFPLRKPVFILCYVILLSMEGLILALRKTPIVVQIPRRISLKDQTRPEQWITGLASSILLLVFLFTCLIAIGRAYSTFDGIANWGLKGYGIALERSVLAGQKWGGHALAYPMNLHLLIALFKIGSGDLIPGSKFIFPLLAGSMLLGSYTFLRRRQVPASVAAAGLLVLITAPPIFEHATLSFANLPFAAYLVLGGLWSLEALWDRRPGAWVIGGLMLSLATWTRPEGVGFVVFIVIALLLTNSRRIKNQIQATVGWLLAVMVVPILWLPFGASQMVDEEIGGGLNIFWQEISHGNFNLDLLLSTLQIGGVRVLSPANWGLFFPIALLLIFLGIKRHHPYQRPLLLASSAVLAFPFMMFFVVFFEGVSIANYIKINFDRAVFPAAVFLLLTGLIMLFAEWKESDLNRDPEG